MVHSLTDLQCITQYLSYVSHNGFIKRLTEEKIHKISGVYGSNMKRASSHKLSAKKVLALNLSKEKDPHR